MDFIMSAVSSTLRAMSRVLPRFSFARDLAGDINMIKPYLQKANVLVPVNTALTILGLWVTIQLALIAYYWITRAINLLRGAG